MTILSRPTITKGTPAIITLSKSDLHGISLISNHARFGNVSNMKFAVFIYENSFKQKKRIDFDMESGATINALFKTSVKLRSDFQLKDIIVMDQDGESFQMTREMLTAAGMNVADEFDMGSEPISFSSLVSQLSQNSGIANIGDTSQYIAQSFEFQSAKTISSIDFYLRKSSSSMVASTIKMEILKESDFSLLGTSDEIVLSAITAISPQAPNAVKFTFPNVAVQANVRYLAKISIVNSVDISVSNTINLVGDTSNPYPYGNAFAYAGGSLNNFSGIDYMFEIFGA